MQKKRLTMLLLLIGMALAGVTVAVAFTVDRGRLGGPAFSRAHHYPETLTFLVLSTGFGLGFYWESEVALRRLFIVAGATVFLFYSSLAVLQVMGLWLTWVPPFVPLVILMGFAIGYAIDRNFFRPKNS